MEKKDYGVETTLEEQIRQIVREEIAAHLNEKDVGKAAINFMAQEARRGHQPLQSP